MPKYRYSPEQLEEAVSNSRNLAEVMRYLGIRISGSSHAHISRRIRALGLDTSHFTGSAHLRGRRGYRLSPPMVLVKMPADAPRVPGSRLKRALLMIGLPEQCERCGIGANWLGAPLTLHVDHINGDHSDNQPHNLRFLCPNCHSQTPTYAGSRRDAVVVSDVVYDPSATTPTGIPLGRRLPRPPAWTWRVWSYRFSGP